MSAGADVMREPMAATHSYWSVLRVVAFLIMAKALYHLLGDWEWIPNEGGWGIGHIVVLILWAAVAYAVDLVMRWSIPNWKVLNISQVVAVVVSVSAMLWMA